MVCVVWLNVIQIDHLESYKTNFFSILVYQRLHYCSASTDGWPSKYLTGASQRSWDSVMSLSKCCLLFSIVNNSYHIYHYFLTSIVCYSMVSLIHHCLLFSIASKSTLSLILVYYSVLSLMKHCPLLSTLFSVVSYRCCLSINIVPYSALSIIQHCLWYRIVSKTTLPMIQHCL